VSHLALLVGLCLIPGIGGVTLRNLLDRFGDIEAIYAASPAALQTVPGVGPRLAAAIKAIDVPLTAAAIAAWEAAGITLLTHSDLRYPALLHGLRDAPPLLFCRGALLPADDLAVSIVGTRQPSPPARAYAAALAGGLAARGWTIVSGLAWGIDLAAHSGALQGGGRTVAILGSGLEQIPPRKRALAARIAANGALLSEIQPDAPPSPPALVARNRLISGMSRAVIVVEAGTESGSLYTARFAYKQERPILAVDNGSEGNTQLLAHGAGRLAAGDTGWDALDRRLRALP